MPDDPQTPDNPQTPDDSRPEPMERPRPAEAHTPPAEASDPATQPGEPSVEETEEQLIAAFTAFRSAEHGAFTPPSIETVHAAARRRQRRRLVASGLAAAATLTLVVSAAALTNLTMDGGALPSADRQTADNATVRAPSPDASPAPHPSKPRKADRKPPPPATRIDVGNATVEVPGMTVNGCAGGMLRFTDGHAYDPGGCVWRVTTSDIRYANLDGTGRREIITTIGSGLPNTEYTSGVIALRVPAPRDAFKAMGYVMTGDNSTQSVQSISATRDGLVTVGIRDSSHNPETPQHQTRSYRWAASAKAFVQVAGPTAFPPPGDDGPGEPDGADPDPTTSGSSSPAPRDTGP